MEIPEEMEVIRVSQGLGVLNDNTQYCISTYFEVIYKNKYFIIYVKRYGNTNNAILDGTETFNMSKRTYYGNYDIADQIRYLKQNYINNVIINKNGVQFSRFAGNWASGRSSDYYGIYFLLPNIKFNEVIVSIYNVWGAFTDNIDKKLLINDRNYKAKALAEGEEIYQCIQLLEKIEDSICFSPAKSMINITPDYYYNKYNTDYARILPTVNNLKMRDKPSLTGEVLGYMKNQLYEIIIIGDEVEIDGIKGNWIRIRPLFGNTTTLSWVFSGYTRKPTEEELSQWAEVF